jgi:pimeloyl-ACP methyl ester carboxylesterase
MVTGLRSELGSDTVFRPFPWKGGNSHVARLGAAAELEQFLEETRRRFAPSDLFVVAHSHGGNVALYAADKLGSKLDALVCLGTPFIRCEPRSFPEPLIRFITMLLWAVAILSPTIPWVVIALIVLQIQNLLTKEIVFWVFIGMANAVVMGGICFLIRRAIRRHRTHATGPAKTSSPWKFSKRNILSSPLTLTIAALAYVTVTVATGYEPLLLLPLLLMTAVHVVAIRRWITRGGPKRYAEKLMEQAKSEGGNLSDKLTARVPYHLPTYVAWTKFDEPFAGLSVSDKLHNLLFRIFGLAFTDVWDWLVPCAVLVGGGFGICFGAGILVSGMRDGFPVFLLVIMAIIGLPVLVWWSAGIPLLLVAIARLVFPVLYPIALLFKTASIGLRRLAYGISGLWEGSLADYLCRVEVTRTPLVAGMFPSLVPWGSRIESRCFIWEQPVGLRHGLHSNPQVIKSVAEWLAGLKRVRNAS